MNASLQCVHRCANCEFTHVQCDCNYLRLQLQLLAIATTHDWELLGQVVIENTYKCDCNQLQLRL